MSIIMYTLYGLVMSQYSCIYGKVLIKGSQERERTVTGIKKGDSNSECKNCVIQLFLNTIDF